MFFEIFFVFFKVSMYSLGGVFGLLPEIERIIVFEKGWLTSDSFYQIYALAQFLPGPNMSMCPLIGYQIAGFEGFMAGFLGIYGTPLVFMAGVVALYKKYERLELVKRLELALRPLVLGLMISSCLRVMWITSSGNHHNHNDPAILMRLGALAWALALFYLYKIKWAGPLSGIFYTGFFWFLYHIFIYGTQSLTNRGLM